MTEDESRQPATSEEDRDAVRRAEDARRRRARVFGDVLPEGTGDERAEGWGDRDPAGDEWLRGQVPPHHG